MLLVSSHTAETVTATPATYNLKSEKIKDSKTNAYRKESEANEYL